MLPGTLTAYHSMPSPDIGEDPDGVTPLWKTERSAIEQALEACDGNIHRAAAMLQVSPSTIYRKRQNWYEQTSEEPNA